MKTFPIVRRLQITYLAFFLFFGAMMGFLVYIFFDLLNPVWDVTQSRSLLMFVLPLFILVPFFLLLIWFGLLAIAVLRVRLVFEDQHLVSISLKRFTFLLPGWLKPSRLPYDQIREVRLNWLPGVVELERLNGRKTMFYPFLFSGKYGEEVLLELRNHVPSEKFAPGMETTELRRKWSRQNKIATTVAILFGVMYLATLAFSPTFSIRARLIDAWQVELSSFWGENVRAYSPDAQGNFWLLSWEPNYYRVYHFSGRVDHEWKLPERLFPGQFPSLVSGDKQGNPIVWFEDGVYYEDGTGWKKILYADGLTLDLWYSNTIVAGEQGWAVSMHGDDLALLKIDALTGKWSELALPGAAIQQGLEPVSMRRSVNGDLLVLMRGENGNRVYVWSGEHWKPQEYSISVPDTFFRQEYFLDEQDSLWALSQTQQEVLIEKMDASGETHLMKLPPPAGSNEWRRYDALFVDSSGRVWISTWGPGSDTDFMSVLNPVWDGQAIEIVRYTPENSNYQHSSRVPPVMLPDGKIWTFDDMLTSMDTRLASLPRPLPNWFAAWDWSWILVAVGVLYLLALVFMYLYFLYDTQVKKQKAATS